MRILVISRHYIPVVSPHAFRWGAIAEYWAGRGHELTILTGAVPGLSRAETINGVEIIRTGNAWASRARQMYGGPTTVVGQGCPPAGRRKSMPARVLRWAHDRTWKQLYWPDAYCGWYPSAALAAVRLSARPWDAVISASIPFTAHLVARAFKRFQPQTPWIVDIADPFSFDGPVPQNNKLLYAERNRLAEQAVIAQASQVAVTCPNTAAEYQRLWPEHSHKFHIIPHLAITQQPSLKPSQDNGPESTCRFSFVGTLDGAVRNPATLFALLSKLRQVGRSAELHVYGIVQNCDRLLEIHKDLIGTAIIFHGAVKRDRAWEQMCAADVLVNVGNDNPFQLPSKLVDYVASTRPILNFVDYANDASTVALSGYTPVLNVVGPPSVLNQSVLTQIMRFISATHFVSEDQRRQWLARFELPAIVQAYERVIEVPCY